MKKILLATLSIEDNSRFEHETNSAYSIGLGYLYSVLEKNGYDVKLQFSNNYSRQVAEERLFECIGEWMPDVIGFQVFSMTRVSTFDAIEKIQNKYPNIKILIGGVHASIMYEQIIRKFPGIFAVIGEGERTIIELLNAIKNGDSLQQVNGIAYYGNDEVVITNPRELIYDLDSLPAPKHDLFFDNEPDRTVAHIISSRGCPFNCSFCCLSIISHRKLRKRSIEKVVEEIKEIKDKYPRLAHVQFHDDTLLIDNERAILLCKLLIEENLGITFECSARVKPVTVEMFEWLERAGCTKIMFGLETGSEKLMKSIHKGVTQKDVINLFYMLKKFKFTVTTFLICGFPGENSETIKETIKFVQKIQKIKYSWIAGVGKLWVYPGTEIYGKMKLAGCIDDSYWLTNNDVPYYTVDNSYKQLVKFEEQLMNAVSFERILTIKGFINHFMVVPFGIISFIKQNPHQLHRLIYGRSALIYFLLKSIKKVLKAVLKLIWIKK